MMKPLPSSGISTSIIPSNQKYSSIVLNSNHFYLSANIGVEKLIAWLNGNNIKYVVLRFFERLPNLHRKGGDIDLLVADEDEEMVKTFLADNASDKSGLFLGVWTPSRANYRKNLTYYPPHLSQQILDSAIKGPAEAKVPSNRLYYLSFLYHCVYRKGLLSGIPTTNKKLKHNPNPENDYLTQIKEIYKTTDGFKLNDPITMESLDAILAKEGWQPEIDTLGKLSLHNLWIWETYFRQRDFVESGVAVIIIRNKIYNQETLHNIRELIRKNSFLIIKEREFDDNDVKLVKQKVRGGSMASVKHEMRPGYALCVLDKYAASALSDLLLLIREKKQGIYKNYRVIKLKNIIRWNIKDDDKDNNSIHTSDNSQEGWSYIKACFYDSYNEVVKRINHQQQKAKSDLVFLLLANIRLIYSWIYLNIKVYFKKLRARNLVKKLLKLSKRTLKHFYPFKKKV